MEKLSVVIITFNEAENIARCIDSVAAIADEIIILDSFSTDETVAIARQKNAIVFQQPFAGYIEQKNAALALATNNWILSLDADEALDPTLLQAIKKEKHQFREAYSMNRCTNYCGQFIRYGNWYPDKKTRLFNKQNARWAGINPHDKIELTENVSVIHLPGDILHYSYNSIESHAIQNNRFSTIAAETMFRLGKKATILKLLASPMWTFLQGYLIRLGFLDGFYGFIIAVNSAHSSFLKYSKLLRLQREANAIN